MRSGKKIIGLSLYRSQAPYGARTIDVLVMKSLTDKYETDKE